LSGDDLHLAREPSSFNWFLRQAHIISTLERFWVSGVRHVTIGGGGFLVLVFGIKR